ncbi:synaptotagmin-like protein 2 [Myxocyprinus asiaticus]|uniref:synaptotagmin-like protein 2 n=1 Tax=Myxocyprinus asiaticus TaxID=70543 RepID=UPI0022219E2D|nr:synaptotagmin-like protein 2 [Myxocyprinus asiaticus]
MKQSKSASEFIDLSFLSAEEEAAIRQVLLRDEDLKRLENGRVRKLRQSVPDLQQLKTLTGEWFEELRVKRYGQETDVTAVVKSSMRWKKTAAHKPNPFLKDILEENKEREKEKRSTPANPSADPRLIHPALDKETYRQYTDEDFTKDETLSFPSVAGKGSSEKQRSANYGKPSLNDTDPRNSSTETRPKELSGDKTTFASPSTVQVQLETKTERGTTKQATNSERRRKVSLPPALRKDQSFEENWVKISLEPNTIKPSQIESSSVGPKLREVNAHVEITETLEKQDLSGHFDINMESPSLKLMDQTEFQIVSKKSPQAEPTHLNQDGSLEISSTELQNLSLASFVESSDGPELSKDTDYEGVEEVSESANDFQDCTAKNQQSSINFMFRELETKKPSLSNSTNDHDKGNVVSGDFLNYETSLDRKGCEEKNVSNAILAETNTSQVKHIAGEEQFNKHSSVEVASQMGSLTWENETESHTFPFETLQGKDNSNYFKDDQSFEIGKKTTSKTQDDLLLQNKRTADASRVKDFEMTSPHRMPEPCVSGKTVQRDLDAHDDKEKIYIKPSNDLNSPKDTHTESQALAELSIDHLSVTNEGNVMHSGDAGLHVDSKHHDKADVEQTQPATGLSYQPTSEDDVAGLVTLLELGQGSLEIKDEEENAETDQRNESDILLSVLARAQKSRPPVLRRITTLEPKPGAGDDMVPTIVIMPSESPNSKEMEGNQHTTSVVDASVEGSTTPSYTADAWEDEGVDSDDDTSLSSYGSDLSNRKGYSASVLSLTDRTGSLLSVYSDAGDFGDVEVQGSVEFAMMFSPVGELIIMIEQCQDLAIANTRKQRTDPYVKTYLYPDKSRHSKRKTSIKKRTVNPVYVESLRYKVKREELPEKTLNLSVWHNDSRGRNVFLGQLEISLKSWDWGHEALSWYSLQPKTAENQESHETHGSLSVSLKYVPPESTGGSKNSTGEIHVWLREAKELRRLKPQGVDSFVKCYILPDTRKKSRQKTRVVKKTQDPVYNHAMVYDGFKAGEVSEACCELTVWDHNTLSNQFLGGLRLSLGTGQSYGKKVDWMDSINEEVEIWKRMLASPNSWVEAELPLRASMTSRK